MLKISGVSGIRSAVAPLFAIYRGSAWAMVEEGRTHMAVYDAFAAVTHVWCARSLDFHPAYIGQYISERGGCRRTVTCCRRRRQAGRARC